MQPCLPAEWSFDDCKPVILREGKAFRQKNAVKGFYDYYAFQPLNSKDGVRVQISSSSPLTQTIYASQITSEPRSNDYTWRSSAFGTSYLRIDIPKIPNAEETLYISVQNGNPYEYVIEVISPFETQPPGNGTNTTGGLQVVVSSSSPSRHIACFSQKMESDADCLRFLLKADTTCPEKQCSGSTLGLCTEYGPGTSCIVRNVTAKGGIGLSWQILSSSSGLMAQAVVKGNYGKVTFYYANPDACIEAAVAMQKSPYSTCKVDGSTLCQESNTMFPITWEYLGLGNPCQVEDIWSQPVVRIDYENW